MLHILRAIETKVQNTPAMSTPIGGRFYLHRAKRTSVMPYAVASTIAAVPEFNTSKTFVQPCGIQISFFCQSLADAETAINAFRSGLTYQPLSLATGRVMTAQLTNETCLDEPSEENEAQSSKHYVLEFEFTQLQAHA